MPDNAPEPGWYHADGDPVGTHRYWDGSGWAGEPQPLPPNVSADPLNLGHPLASPWRRIGARLIDLVILIGVSTLVEALVDDDISATPSATAAILSLMVTVAYEVGMIAALGATVGKLVAGVRVVDPTGTYPPGSVTAIRRWAPNLLVLIPVLGIALALATMLASLLWIFTDDRRRSIFDRVAPTFVVTVG